MGRRVCLIAAIIFSCFLILSQIADAQSIKHITGKGWFGVTSKDEYSRIWNYLLDNDKEAFAKALTTSIMLGRATIFKNGETVYLVDTSIFSGLIKIRRKGEITEFWTDFNSVK